MTAIESAVAAHESRNRELVRLIREKGADLFAPRPIDLHFWVGRPADAQRLADALRSQGLDPVGVAQPASPGAKLSVEARVEASVTEVIAVGFTERYVRLALQHSGEYDGWGTVL